MKRGFLGILLAVVFSGCRGCERRVQEYSPIVTERAVIADLVFTPSRHGSGIGPTFDLTREGGIGIAVTSVNVPERYAVVFKCAHGKFIVQSDQRLAKRLWGLFTEGQEVTVKYREVYWSVYKEDRLVSRKLTDYDFVDAE